MNNPINKRLTYTFTATGHPNIRATHFKTLEFTKDEDITERGDCIVGVKATFELTELDKFKEKDVKKIKCMISLSEDEKEHFFECKFTLNTLFESNHELVLRKSSFNSDRTFGFNLNRGANKIPREMVKIMQNPDTVIKIKLIEGWY